MAEQPAKRHKIDARGQDGYMPGNILEVELCNFMTYAHVVFKPAPRLSLLIGPNGSGKSSFVCAIALGLAGEPQILGRATSIGAFVKRGEESGSIRISLRGDTAGNCINITRRIDVHNKSDWLLNGKSVPRRDIIDVVKRFNIQVNNLTQFLPQDRVCEFAKLSPVQLLEETEKAVGKPELPVQHRALIDKSWELKKLEMTVKQNRDTLSQLKVLNAEQEKDAERVRQREQLLEKVEIMKKKLPWLKYDMKKNEFIQTKRQEEVAKQNLDESAKILNGLKAPVEEKKQVKMELESRCKKLNNLLSQNGNRRREILDQENHLTIQLRVKHKEIDDLRRQEESRQQRISKAKEDVAAAEMELVNLPVYEPPKSEIERLGAQIVELQQSAFQKRSQKTEKETILNHMRGSLKRCIDRLKDMEGKNNKLLHALHGVGAERIFEAHEWLQKHRQELRKEVYGPVLLEVNVPSRAHATFLEDQVPLYVWKSFVTQDSSDRDHLVRCLRQFDVPILNFVEDRSPNRGVFHVPEEMRRIGIFSRLDQVFDAPRAVKEVLINQAGLDRSYIGTTQTDQNADSAPQLGIFDLWTPENHYRWSKSRYGGQISAVVQPVNPSKLFMASVDVEAIATFRAKKEELAGDIIDMEQTFKALQSEEIHLDNKAAEFIKQRESIIATVQLQKKKRRDMENRLCQKKQKLEAIEKEDDLDTNTNRLMDQAAKVNERRFQLALEIKSLLVEAVCSKWAFAEKYMSSLEMDTKIREMEVGVKQQMKIALHASMQFENCKNATENCRSQLSALKKHAESISTITPQLEQAFLQMPTTIEELEATIQDTIAEAQSMFFINNNILEEYESRRSKIASLEQRLEVDTKELTLCLSQIDSVKETWLIALRNLIAKINETFSRNFQEMAIAGEVTLDEQGMDFDKYGVRIKVKFRQTGQLQVLSAHHQSGGERSVSTILYLVSLQDLTNCPFRVVDEINQGMDPENERKMFQQLVRAASQPNTPQCFLLTPKLLSGLEYGEVCSVLLIEVGPRIKQVADAWRKGGKWSETDGRV